MAVTGLGRQETCIVHHDRPAAARCGRCHKPICSECVISASDGKFCSRVCADKAADFRKSYGKVKKTSRGVRKLVRLVVWIVVIIVALAAINKYFMNNNMRVLGPFLNKLPIFRPSKKPTGGQPSVPRVGTSPAPTPGPAQT